MPLGGILFISIFILAFGYLLLGLAKLTGTKVQRKHQIKYEPYECGLPGQEKRDTKISVKFYLTAILFILFDIEIIFMYPWAVVLPELGVFGFVEMLFFMLILVVGLVYVWKKGVLNWND